MPLYDEDDDPGPVPDVDFAALLAAIPPRPDAVGPLIGHILDRRDSGVPAGHALDDERGQRLLREAFPPPATSQTLLRGEPVPGRGISSCQACGGERWYGTGPCSTCQKSTAAGNGMLPPPPPGSRPVSAPVSEEPRLRPSPDSAFGQMAAAHRRRQNPGPDLTEEDVADVPYGEPEPDPAFAAQVADALERLAPQSGQALAPHQIPPPEHEDPDSDVTGWVMLAGRNAGKTYAGARWLDRFMRQAPNLRARIIAPSFGDAVASCVEGPSGILAASNYQVRWKPAHPGGAQLVWPNGGVCYVIGTPTPRDVDRLRAIGNVDADWFEEAAANPQIVEAERQARLSRRRKGAKWIATTTPRPLKIIRDWKKDRAVRVSAATAHDNKHADPLWLEELERMYKGTRLYAQEVLGQVLEDVEGALWNAEMIERSRVVGLAQFYEMLEETGRAIARAAVGVDPANSTGTTGIVAVVMTDDRHLWVVDDVSKPGQSADQWARSAVDLARRWNAALVPENDSGGDAIRAVLKSADLLDEVTIIPATARGHGGKGARAEPIALLWERDDFRGHVVGTHPLLEEEMTTYVDGVTKESPDRMDAMVWACTYLWSRAGFESVSADFPGATGDPTRRAASRRPGTMIRWHGGMKRRVNAKG